MITIHNNVIQGTPEWYALRLGILTASEMHLAITPTLRVARNGETRAHIYELAAQRATKYVEPHYISDDMLRGHTDEPLARAAYAEHYSPDAPVIEAGFITREYDDGLIIGCSPDSLVGDNGGLEIKSRRQKKHLQTIIENEIPPENIIQVQTCLMITGREWWDYVSYCGGMALHVIRAYPDQVVHDAILTAAHEFEAQIVDVVEKYSKVAKFAPIMERIEALEDGDIK